MQPTTAPRKRMLGRAPLRWFAALAAAALLVGGLVWLSAPAAEQTATAAKQSEPTPNAKQANDKQDTGRADELFPNRIRCPSLEGGVGWLNTAGPIRLEDLRGKVVVLDFWTYCCINCMHMLPVLDKLEKKYGNELVVIGVHSAKFFTEQETDNIRQAILRYEIKHPVINDAEMTVWRKHGVSSWPTIRIIDPEGYLVAGDSGEIPFEVLDFFIGRLVEHHRKKGTLDEGPLRFELETYAAAQTPLRYPGKVLADVAGSRLIIADSNHNRIVVTTLDGELLTTIGTGRIGADDGPFDEATFDHPQGMALDGQTLYVADTENHLVRKVDLESKTVSTIAGTGKQARTRTRDPDAPARTTALNSPWDLELVGNKLYIAMAGPHQIWVLDLEAETVGPYAGSGREDILDGPLAEAALAQPSGITGDGRTLYVVDSEGNAIRSIADGKVETVVGPHDLPFGRSLFTFADVDGKGDEVRFQHPIGLTLHQGKLYVADTYNNKIKEVDPQAGTARTLFGDGEPGDRDEPSRFDEPAGVTAAGDSLYIADTNNHAIRVADLASGKVRTLAIAGLAPPAPSRPRPTFPNATSVDLKPQTVSADDQLVLHVEITLPESFKLNPDVPLRYLVESDEEQGLVDRKALGELQAIEKPEQSFDIRLPVTASQGEDRLRVSLLYYSCREGAEAVCKINSAVWNVPVRVSPSAPSPRVHLKTTPAAFDSVRRTALPGRQ